MHTSHVSIPTFSDAEGIARIKAGEHPVKVAAERVNMDATALRKLRRMTERIHAPLKEPAYAR